MSNTSISLPTYIIEGVDISLAGIVTLGRDIIPVRSCEGEEELQYGVPGQGQLAHILSSVEVVEPGLQESVRDVQLITARSQDQEAD